MKIGYRTVLFLLLYVLPLSVICFYELRVASNRYHSDSTISISTGNNPTPSLDLSMIGLPAAADDRDALTVSTFISSLDMLQYLESKLKIREHYSDSSVDWWTRLPASASLEDFHEYMKNYIVVTSDASSHLLTIHVEAFDREYAQKVLITVLKRSQEFVDDLNSRVTIQQTKFFETELKQTEKRLRDAKDELLNFQRENGLLTTDVEAQMVSANIAQLTALLIAKQGEIEANRRELNENSPVMQNLRAEAETLKKQISAEKDRLSRGSSGAAVSELSARFKEIEFNLDFLQTVYKSNVAQLERARVEASQRLKYLVVVTTPTLADSSLFPDRRYNIVTAGLILLVVYFILSLMAAIIREHI